MHDTLLYIAALEHAKNRCSLRAIYNSHGNYVPTIAKHTQVNCMIQLIMRLYMYFVCV